MKSDMIEFCKEIIMLTKQSAREVIEYSLPEVNFIISQNVKDEKRIEKTLDLMLEVAFDEQVLKIFKKLCRYYYFINPKAAVWYVNQYKAKYDDCNQEGEL